VEALKASVADYERAVAETEHRLERERADTEVAGNELTEARARVGDLGTRVSELERQLFVQQTEAATLNRRRHELATPTSDQGRRPPERDSQLDRARAALEAAVNIEADLRRELAATGNRSNSAVDRFRSEISQLEAQLAAAIEDRNKLQREIGTMKRDTE